MHTLKTLALAALAGLVVSNSFGSLATAGGLQIVGRPAQPIINVVIPVSPAGNIPYIPIKVEPVQPNIPFIPIKVIPQTPNIPIIPGAINLLKKNKQETPTLMVDCKVKDTAPTTDDLWIVNAGADELPAGLKLRFSVPSTGDKGAFMLNNSVPSGKKIKVSDLLHGAQSGAPCRVQII